MFSGGGAVEFSGDEDVVADGFFGHAEILGDLFGGHAFSEAVFDFFSSGGGAVLGFSFVGEFYLAF